VVRLCTLIEKSGAVTAAKEALASADWWDGLVELWSRGETLRSLEALVLRPEFCALFTDKERDEARKRLDECPSALQVEGEVVLVSSVPTQPPTPGGRTVPDPSRYNNLNSQERIEQQERDLKNGLTLQATSWDRSHLEECAQCAEAHPVVVEAYRRSDSDAVDKLQDLLEVLKICLDYNSHKVELLLERMNLSSTRPEDREGWNVDENVFRTLCSESENNLPPLLEQRAAMVAAYVGYFISRYASTLGSHADDRLLPWREGVGPPVLSNFVRRLDRDDFLNLLIADQCYRVWPGYDPVDVLRVPSYAEFQPVAGVLETEEFPLPRIGYTPSFSFGYFMDCVRDGAMWRHPECKGAQCVRPELRTATPPASNAKDSPPRRRREPSLEDRGNPLEASCRKAMGGDLFVELVPQARPSALQAEYLFHRRGCPEPSDIVFSLARAFEIQMKNGWLKGFADYLLEKGIRDDPEVSDFKALLFPKSQRERPTLGEMKKLVETDSRHLDEYGAKCGNELKKVRTALSRVVDFRNQAGHQGCLSFELANQIRSDWLGQSRRGGGIFEAVLPCGLPPA
jgi:hypothetical protein